MPALPLLFTATALARTLVPSICTTWLRAAEVLLNWHNFRLPFFFFANRVADGELCGPATNPHITSRRQQCLLPLQTEGLFPVVHPEEFSFRPLSVELPDPQAAALPLY
jgi:hypothetical protein